MNIQHLKYKNYRNLHCGIIIPNKGINIIYGDNAQGKTNLLEAFWLFTGGRSFRGAKDSDLILQGEKKAQLDLCFYSEEREQTAQIIIENGHRNAVLNGIPKKSSAGIVGKFCAVIFSPEHIALVREGPSLRRNFIDSALCQIKPGYALLLSRYNRTLTQRNTLLKDIPRHSELIDTLEIWDEKLASYGESIVKFRIEYIEMIKKPAEKIYSGICKNKEVLNLAYKKSAENLKDMLLKSRRDDIISGHTNYGPHRDDIKMTINSMSARSFGSQGQKRSVVLALKLAEAEIIFRQTGERPVVLLDDVMSELDSSRQEYLLNHLNDCQVFITCCEPESLKLLKNGSLFNMKSGELLKK